MLTPEEFSRRPSLRRVGTYLMFLGVLGVAGGALIYALLMSQLGWSTGGMALGSGGTGRAVSSLRVLLYRSSTTERFFQAVGGNHQVLVQPWQRYAEETGVSWRELRTLQGLEPRYGDVLVLPASVALNEQEREAILRYSRSGGNVFATWATGSRFAEGVWAGWDFLQQLGGVQVVGEVPLQTAASALFTRAEGPLTHNLPPGTQVRLGQSPEHALLLRGAHVAAGMHPALDAEYRSQGLLTYREAQDGQNGRTVVWGVSESAWVHQTGDIYRLLTASLSWLAHQPGVTRSVWPQGLSAAYLVDVDAQGDLDSVEALAPQLARAGWKGNFYLDAKLLNAPGESVRGLAQAHDVHLWVKRHAGVPGEGEGVSASIRSDLPRAQGFLRGFKVNAAPVQDDQTSAQAPVSDDTYNVAGFRHRLETGGFRKSLAPAFAPVRGEKADDRFVEIQGLGSRAWVSAGGLAEPPAHFDAVRHLGGLGVLEWPADASATELPPLPPTHEAFLRQLRNQGHAVWLTTSSEVARWWVERERFQLKVRTAGARVEFDISILGDKPFSGAALVVVLPGAQQKPRVQGLKSGMPEPEIQLMDEFRAVMRFPVLKPGNYTYLATF